MVQNKLASIAETEKVKTIKMNRNVFWLLDLIYGDAAFDRTARFQIPQNVIFRSLNK